MRSTWGAIVAGIAGVVALVGCVGDTDDRPATFSYVWTTVVLPNCTTAQCHTNPVATQSLRLDTLEGAYLMFTGRACDDDVVPGEAERNFVTPGEPQRSKLIYLLRGIEVERRMPPDAPLPEPDIELVERWILDGAECN